MGKNITKDDLDSKNKTDRVTQLQSMRKQISLIIKTTTTIVIYVVIFLLTPKLFSAYQKHISGIEFLIRNHSIGPITGFQPPWENILYNIKGLIFPKILFIILT